MLLSRLSIYGAWLLALLMSWAGQAAGGELEARLRTAAAGGDAREVAALLAQGADMEARDRQGRTPLLIATHHNQVAAARVLIEAGADVNAKDNISDSPYLYAGARGHNEILRLTLAHGADLASLNRYGGTALIPAAERGHVDTVRLLIDAGVDLDHINRLHWTALMEAIVLGRGGAEHTEIVRLLVEAGADPNIADADGISPLRHARQRGYAAMVLILERAGAR
ncbi:ankyrin repeat domain-containing protein [Zobellella iuensis]|uniref:Ankyrin repeat domain-containing protein n=1 Tax=Zobellella iuensis TaxID=2803811 RepID=A0ABS1QRX2_9GAMM|nr:ankyrin repeat domain-containing protein [Zobellella iuensis]MBL1377623.1 ankyrin repeat domain-containing protein [Zobellella iuensis]